MLSGPLRPAPVAYHPHNGLVLYAVLAGAAMVALGAVRLRLPTAHDSPYTARGIAATYGIMIAIGMLLIGLAVRWKFSL